MKLKQIRVDGYKNLINCVLNLGDFNVIVGPNNSGKSNFLEIFPILLRIHVGHKAAELFEKNPFVRPGSLFCNLKGYKKRGLTIKAVFDTKMRGEAWRVEYGISIGRPTRSRGDEDHEYYFERETIRGKPPGRRGAWKIFLKRKPDELRIAVKNRPKYYRIGNTVSSFEFIRSVYPDAEELGKDFKKILSGMFDAWSSNILALEPDLVRQWMSQESGLVPFIRNPFVPILFEVDKIYDDRKLFGLFENAVCDILDLESVHFARESVYTESKGEKKKELVQRLMSFAIKKSGMGYSDVGNYSDGTLVGIAILAGLFSKKRRGSMLCIEEPENYLHPRAIEKLLRFLQDHSNKWPVLITTHSPYLLNGVKPEDVNVAVVDNTGAAHFEKVKNSRQLRDYLNKGLMSFGELLVKDFEGFREG